MLLAYQIVILAGQICTLPRQLNKEDESAKPLFILCIWIFEKQCAVHAISVLDKIGILSIKFLKVWFFKNTNHFVLKQLSFQVGSS